MRSQLTLGRISLLGFLWAAFFFAISCVHHPAGENCLGDDDCASGWYCDILSGRCKERCKQDGDCKAGEACDTAKGRCGIAKDCSQAHHTTCQGGHLYLVDLCGSYQRLQDCEERGCSGGSCNQMNPSGCGDGVCVANAGEDCVSCPIDCACPMGERCDPQNKACEAAPACGDGHCEDSQREDCVSCPIDCACPTGERCDPTQQACVSFLSCGDGLCDANEGENCASCPIDCACPSGNRCINSTCQRVNPCGDGVCRAADNENCDTCPVDCKCPSGQSCRNASCQISSTPPVCGDGRCEGNESKSNCCSDCGCPSGQSCRNGSCQEDPAQASCGNGKCESGESQSNCCRDCGCASGFSCNNNQCVCTQHECSAGVYRCSGSTPQQCRQDNSGCARWVNLTACTSGQTCSNGNCVSTTCQTSHQCPTEGDRICSGGKAMDCKLVNYCRTLVLGDDCAAKGMTCDQSIPDYAICRCSSTCQLNAKRCSSGRPQECRSGSGSCNQWVNLTACASNQTCDAGICKTNCTHQCPTEGDRICSGGRAMDCKLVNGCRTLVLGDDCAAKGMTCDQSIPEYAICRCSSTCSLNAKRCLSGRPQECRSGSGSCNVWVNLTACTSTQTCSNGNCVTNCPAPCALNAVRCSSNTIQTCQRVNGCNIWVNGTNCASTNRTCRDGVCCSGTICPQ